MVLVKEHLDEAHTPTPAQGIRQVLNARDYRLRFTVSAVPTVRTLVAVDIWTGQKGGSLRLYFLPWYQNAATQMTIPAGGGGPAIFMTSMLSGCTVQVMGTAANPTIIHANASNKYNNAYDDAKKILNAQGMEGKTAHIHAESRGNAAATGAIDAMLPDPAGGLIGTVRKLDYALQASDQRLLNIAKTQFNETLDRNKQVRKYKVATMGEFKPKTGAFVYGLRNVHNNWSFFYQAAVEVKVEVGSRYWILDKLGIKNRDQFTYDSAVLGQTTKFFPP